MARITKPLTNTQIEQAKPKTKVYTLSDGSGLQLRVKPNGSKLQIFSQIAFLQFCRKAEQNKGGCKTCNSNLR